MELEYYGGNCLKITAKKATIVIDDNLESLGQQSIIKPKDIALYTTAAIKQTREAQFIIDMPGEYEVSDISIIGVAARAHMDEANTRSATIYRITINDIKIAVVGHIYPELTDDELEAIGTVDILAIPVGGNGFTLDGIGAVTIIKKIEPSIVIPTHYADKALNYEVPPMDLETALKGLSMEPAETVEKLKLKSRDFAENTQLIVLERQ